MRTNFVVLLICGMVGIACVCDFQTAGRAVSTVGRPCLQLESSKVFGSAQCWEADATKTQQACTTGTHPLCLDAGGPKATKPVLNAVAAGACHNIAYDNCPCSGTFAYEGIVTCTGTGGS